MKRGELAVIERGGLTALIGVLRDGGYCTVGPVVRDGAICLGEVRTADDLPAGVRDVQAPGSYRIEKTEDPALFGWAVGPESVKAHVFPARAEIWRAQPGEDGVIAVTEIEDDARPVAVVGARPCELAAMAILDRVLGAGAHPDPLYRRRRSATFVVAVECATPADTCFCASMTTGPGATDGFDLALTELVDDQGHRFLVRVGSERGGTVLAAVPRREATPGEQAARAALLREAAARMGRRMDTAGLPGLLARNPEHPRWDAVAARCLSCGNCTMVCPTCFCGTVEDVTDLAGTITRRRAWGSCFDLAHSYMHGGPVRRSTRARYRQWLSHKLSTWWDQFGRSGCVGCGRCITWCPAAIDITAEVAAIRATDAAGGD